MKEIKGIIPIVAAVFDHEGNADLTGFRQLVRHLLGTGADGLALFGLATEFYKLTDAERSAMQLAMLAETSADPSVSGIVSITSHSWEIAARQAKEAEFGGADALMLFPPFFLSPSLDAILTHAKKVANAVSIPVIVQYAPSQTGVSIPPEIFVELRRECPNARFVKVETQPPGRYADVLHETSNRQIQTLIGYAGIQMTDVLERGSAGIQPGCSFTEIYVALHRMFVNGQKKEMNALFQQLLPYISYWMQGVELVIKAEKTILQRRGIIASNYCRHPEYRLDQREERMIDQFLEQFQTFL